jgi:chromosome segregation ATPase
MLNSIHNKIIEAEIRLIEASSELEVLVDQNRSIKETLEQKQREVQDMTRETARLKQEATNALDEVKRISAENAGIDEFIHSLPENQTIEELEADIESERAKLELVHEGNPNAIREFEARQRKIDDLKEKVDRVDEKLVQIDEGIAELRGKWEPELDMLVKEISDAFALNFEKIGCAGEVMVHKEGEDFDQWAIQIKVKFRYATIYR